MRLNSMRYQILFLLWCAIPSVGSEEVIFCFDFSHCPWLCVALHVSSSAGVRVFSISEVWTTPHSASLVHISSILLSAHNCSRVSSPSIEGNSHLFGAVWAILFCRVFHVAWWDTVIVSFCSKEYLVICPTVWIGRFSSVTVSPFAKSHTHP